MTGIAQHVNFTQALASTFSTHNIFITIIDFACKFDYHGESALYAEMSTSWIIVQGPTNDQFNTKTGLIG